MKRTIKFFAIMAAVLAADICMAEMPERKWVWIKTDMTSYRSEMLTIPVKFVIGVPQPKGSYYSHTCVYAMGDAPNAGRWQRPHQIWNNENRIGKLIGKWDLRSPDGAEAFAGIAAELVTIPGNTESIGENVWSFCLP